MTAARRDFSEGSGAAAPATRGRAKRLLTGWDSYRVVVVVDDEVVEVDVEVELVVVLLRARVVLVVAGERCSAVVEVEGGGAGMSAVGLRPLMGPSCKISPRALDRSRGSTPARPEGARRTAAA